MNPYDENNMYKAYLRAVKGSRWKGSSQRYMNDFLGQNALLGEQIRTGTYRSDLTSEFMICERGKTRAIAGNTVRDRVVRHALCDNVLMPAIQPKIIAANCASQTGKGTGYARKTIKEHLHDYYRHYGNKGYILLIDYTKYYDNIHHDIAYEQLAELVPDEESRKLLREVLDNMKVDVSYLGDEDYAHCMEKTFDSVAYHREIPKELKTGNRFMRKSCRIGDQVSQIIGIYYPHRIDNLIKCVLGEKYYLRFNDDSYVISPSKERLKYILQQVITESEEIGLKINLKKTVIRPIDKPFKFLKFTYWLTETGRVPEKINKKNIVRQRQKMKKLAKLGIPYADAKSEFDSWMGTYRKTMSKIQIRNMKQLFDSLWRGKENGDSNDCIK